MSREADGPTRCSALIGVEEIRCPTMAAMWTDVTDRRTVVLRQILIGPLSTLNLWIGFFYFISILN